MKEVLILGGAGFIGSQITKKFSEKKMNVTVIDAFLNRTEAEPPNISQIKHTNLIKKRIEDIPNLSQLVSRFDIVIDSMGWTSHLGAINNPNLDLKLNLESHLCLLNSIRNCLKANQLLIYLGSTMQYGSNNLDFIDENSQMIPIDIQGVNKVSAENYFRVFSRLYGINVVSLRIPNCFGVNQPYEGEDIGLIGGFMRSSIVNKQIEVYGKNRYRSIICIDDLTEIIFKIASVDNVSFEAYNVPSEHITIEDLAKKIASKTKNCKIKFKKIPTEYKVFENNQSRFSSEKILKKINHFELRNLDFSIESTYQYFKNKLNDL